MREIKFRVFHKKIQSCLPVWIIDFQFQMLQIWTEDTWISFNNVELMQYTGLKDKNGEEIYEGDIIAVKMHSGKYENYKIVWINDWREVDKDNPNEIYCAEFVAINDKKGTHFNWIDSSLWHDCEIIGNIYENPELMKVAEYKQ